MQSAQMESSIYHNDSVTKNSKNVNLIAKRRKD